MTTQTETLDQKKTASPESEELTRDVPTYIPATDIYETEESIVVVSDMPGIDEKHVGVDLENTTLTITGHRVDESPSGRRMLCCGYTPGDYKRTFELSDDVDRDGIKAQMKDGVLRITLNKARELQPQRIEVEAGDR